MTWSFLTTGMENPPLIGNASDQQIQTTVLSSLEQTTVL